MTQQTRFQLDEAIKEYSARVEFWEKEIARLKIELSKAEAEAARARQWRKAISDDVDAATEKTAPSVN